MQMQWSTRIYREILIPFKGLCGAAVVYKVVEALYNVMGQDADDVDFLMENVAIATVGDVMDLVDENRIFVKQGLEMLKRTQNEGLKALMECTQVPIERLSAYHIGFVIGHVSMRAGDWIRQSGHWSSLR